jgi:RNA recognition motif-containing protein
VVIQENTASKKIIVKNVAWGATDLELKRLLGEAGEVFSIQGTKDSEGKDKDHRIVEYKTRSEASKAKKTLNNRELKGRPMHVVEYKEDIRKESL